MSPVKGNSREFSTASSSGRSGHQSTGKGGRSSAVEPEKKDATDVPEDEESSDSDSGDSVTSKDSYSSVETHQQRRRDEWNQRERAKMEEIERRRKEKEERQSTGLTKNRAEDEQSSDSDIDNAVTSKDSYSSVEMHQQRRRDEWNQRERAKMEEIERRRKEKEERQSYMFTVESATSSEGTGDDGIDSTFEDHQRKNRERMTAQQWENKRRGDERRETERRERTDDQGDGERGSNQLSGSDTNDSDSEMTATPAVNRQSTEQPPPYEFATIKMSQEAKAHIPSELFTNTVKPPPPRRKSTSLRTSTTAEGPIQTEPRVAKKENQPSRKSAVGHVDAEHVQEEAVPASADSESLTAPNNQPTPPAGPTTPEVSSPERSHRVLEQQQRNAHVDGELLERYVSPQENDGGFFTSTPAFKPGSIRGHVHLNISPIVGKTVSARNVFLTQKKKPKERPLSQRDDVLIRTAQFANAKDASPVATEVAVGDEIETPESEPAAVALSPLPKGQKDGETDTRSSRRKPETALPSTSAGTEAVVSGKPETEEVQPAATCTVQPLPAGRRDDGTAMRSSQKQPESAAPSSTARINEPVVDGETEVVENEPVSAAALPPLPKGKRGGPPVDPTRSSRRKPKVAQPSTSAVGETETHEEEEPAAVALQSRPKGRRIDGSTVTRSSRVKRKAPQPSSSDPTEAVAGGKTDALEDDPGAAAVAVLPIPKGKKAGSTTKRSRRERKIAQPSSSAAGEVETSEDEHASEVAPSPLPKGRKDGATSTKPSRKKPKITLPSSLARPLPIREVSEEDEEDDIQGRGNWEDVPTSQSHPVRDKPVADPSGSQLTVAHAEAAPSKRTAGSSKRKGGRPKSRREKTPERYVGNDVFGNYRMMTSADVARILESVRPNHKLSEEKIKRVTRKINYFLEDFFCDQCNNTPHPLGFVPFQQLKQGLIDQCLLEEGATTEDLMAEMKQSVPKADWKRSEGILYPHRNSKKDDTDDYY